MSNATLHFYTENEKKVTECYVRIIVRSFRFRDEKCGILFKKMTFKDKSKLESKVTTKF